MLFVRAWLCVILVNALVLRPLYPVNRKTGLILAVGLLCFTIGSLDPKRNDFLATKVQRVSGRSLRIWAVVVSVALLVGTFYFQGRVAAAAAGVADSANRDAATIRYETTHGAARGGSFEALPFALASVVGCVGILAGLRLSRRWYLMLPLGFWATKQRPDRGFTLALAAAAIPVFLYSRTGAGTGAVSKRFITVASKIASAGGTLLYSNSVETSLGKTTVLSRYVPSTAVPVWLASAVAYKTGGISAPSKAQETNHNPVGAFGTSVFAIVRVGAALTLSANIPQSISEFVFTPIPLNVYTTFGQVWFDFGSVKLVALSVVVGALNGYSHAFSLERTVSWAWTSSLLLTVLALTPLTLRLLNVDGLMQLAVGLVICWTVSRAGPVSCRLRGRLLAPPGGAHTPMQTTSVSSPAAPRNSGYGG